MSLVAELRQAATSTLLYATLDGAQRLIAKRTIVIKDAHPTFLLRKVFLDATNDNATSLIVAMGCKERALQAEMFDLTLARDLHAMAHLFMIRVDQHYIVNSQSQMSLKGESW